MDSNSQPLGTIIQNLRDQYNREHTPVEDAYRAWEKEEMADRPAMVDPLRQAFRAGWESCLLADGDTTDEEMRHISLKEFVEAGYLQEVNRFLLHPLGLALTFHQLQSGEVVFSGIRDNRHDPEGFAYEDPPSAELARAIAVEFAKRALVRVQHLGWNVQPAE